MKRAAGFAAALALAACAQMPSGEQAASTRPARETIQRFTLEGRIAVSDGEQHHAVRLDWRHTPEDDVILISTPFGQGLARLTRDASGARLDTADERRYEAGDMESLSARLFGRPLPFEGMPRWVLGLGTGGSLPQEVDEHGRARAISEHGWRVEFAQYESEAAGALPILLRLSRAPLELRLRVDRWEVDQ